VFKATWTLEERRNRQDLIEIFTMEAAMNTGRRTFSPWTTNTGKNNMWISTFHSTGGALCLSLCHSFL